jgi:hypothetical protein
VGMALTSSDNVVGDAASGVVSLVSLLESLRGLAIPSAGVFGAIKQLGLGGLLDLRGLLLAVEPVVIPVAATSNVRVWMCMQRCSRKM